MTKDQVTIIATLAVAAGSAALFVAARIKARKTTVTVEKMDEKKPAKILKNNPSN